MELASRQPASSAAEVVRRLQPRQSQPQLGGERGFEVFTAALHRFGMGLILDFVPNHMSASSENPWWLDMLENGPTSPYAHYFDVDWQPEKAELANKILLPILEGQYGEVLKSGQFQLRHTDGDSR